VICGTEDVSGQKGMGRKRRRTTRNSTTLTVPHSSSPNSSMLTPCSSHCRLMTPRSFSPRSAEVTGALRRPAAAWWEGEPGREEDAVTAERVWRRKVASRRSPCCAAKGQKRQSFDGGDSPALFTRTRGRRYIVRRTRTYSRLPSTHPSPPKPQQAPPPSCSSRPPQLPASQPSSQTSG
jgi:hypothetical protein